MSQPRWRDSEGSAAYRDAAGRYGAPQAATRRNDPHAASRRNDPHAASRRNDPYAAAGHNERRQRQARRQQPPERSQLAVRWGRLPGRFGVFVVIGSAALGALLTALTNSAPGLVLGVFLVAGTVAGALAVRPRTGYLIIPVPAIAYLIAALIAGLIYDRSNDHSRTMLAVNGTQWIASGFIAMALATAAAIAIPAVRWRRRSAAPGRTAAPNRSAAPGGSATPARPGAGARAPNRRDGPAH